MRSEHWDKFPGYAMSHCGGSGPIASRSKWRSTFRLRAGTMQHSSTRKVKYSAPIGRTIYRNSRDRRDDSAEMIDQFRAWSTRLTPLALSVRKLRLSARGSWHIEATGPKGSLTLELGRDDADARLARFVAAQPRTLGTLATVGNACGLRRSALSEWFRHSRAAIPGKDSPSRPHKGSRDNEW